MKKVSVIGIGAGDPDHLTVQAIKALDEVDVFFVVDKGAEKATLATMRKDIIQRYATTKPYRIVEVDDPVRDRTEPAYRDAVHAWHDARTAQYAALIDQEIADGHRGAFLAWGDPSLYDSILRILREIASKGEPAFDYEVVPGITSVQALAAKHRMPINDVGGSIAITTGRRLASSGLPDDFDHVIVMLDGNCAFRTVTEDVDIYWGAYVGTPDEILMSGRLRDVEVEIEQRRREARQAKGWIMDTYVLRRRPDR